MKTYWFWHRNKLIGSGRGTTQRTGEIIVKFGVKDALLFICMFATGLDVKADDELRCLALNIYHEARDQHLQGQIAVGQVTLNRVNDGRWPDTVCGVVKDKHQFSWYWDGKSDKPTEKASWALSKQIAYTLLYEPERALHDFSNGALYYWNPKHAAPLSWMRRVEHVVTLEDHSFYADK